MKNILSCFFLLLLSAEYSIAQNPETFSASEILLRMKKLNVLGSVLYIAAHPDDENTRLLAWLSQDKLYRTGYLSLTRGDGGQNLIGDEQGIELGLIVHRNYWPHDGWTGQNNFLPALTILDFRKQLPKHLNYGMSRKC